MPNSSPASAQTSPVPSAASTASTASTAGRKLASSLPRALRALFSPQQAAAAFRAHTAHARGLPAKLSAWQLVLCMVAQAFAGSGELALHVFRMTSVSLSNAALCQRRRTAGWAVFATLLEHALRPLAELARHPGAFYAGLRLVAIDGTEHSLTNTPSILRKLKKAASRRASAAFAKLRTCVLLELHAHNPLRVAAGLGGESELALARTLFAHLPPQALLLVDRLYGVPAVVHEILTAMQERGSHLLVRVRRNIKVTVVRVLRDGSALITVPVPQRGVPRRHWPLLTLREIRGRVQRPGGTWSELRLWTSLLDARAHPAGALLELYAQRWEHELYYRELKQVFQGGAKLLRGHSVESAAQEMACVIMASALVARTRLEMAQSLGTGAPRVSLRRVRALMEPLWLMLQAAEGLLSARQISAIVERIETLMQREALLPPRRARSSPRAVRAPVSKWPRLLTRQETKGRPKLKITRIKKS